MNISLKRSKEDKNLLQLVKKKGILIKVMPKGTSIVFEPIRTEYKKELGAVAKKNISGNITHVYIVYEDYDSLIKYYDYPQYTKKDIDELVSALKDIIKE